MRRIVMLMLFIFALGWAADQAEAQRRGGGGRGGGGGFRGGGGGRGGSHFSRGGSRSAVNARPSQRPAQRSSFDRGNVNRGNINRGDINRGDINRADISNRRYDRDVNVNRPVNIGEINGGYGDWDNGWGYHPVARGAAWGAAAAVTSAAIGSAIYTLPSSCVVVVDDGSTYHQCGSTWYQPQFVGTETQYIVVSPPY